MTATTKPRTPAQVAAEGFRALVEKLGVVDAIRFLRLYDPGHGDYTAERRQWLDQTAMDEWARLMSEAQAQRDRPSIQ
jgi:hypothetical protein